MGTPLGTFVRAKRDSLRPEDLGLPALERRRAPGLRRSELATRAGISVEYLTRIEQGRDRNPSDSILRALADALSLDPAERTHLRYLAKISGGTCAGRERPAPPDRTVRPAVRRILELLEPGIGFVTNRLGDVLAHTDGFAAVMRDTGLLDAEEPNLTRYVFTHPGSRSIFAHWDQVADEQVFNLWLGPSTETFEWFTADFAPAAGAEFTRRLHRHLPPPRVPLTINHPRANRLQWERETLELPTPDAQQLVVWLPADEATAVAVERLRHRPQRSTLRAV
ncbi:helix-turn-helix domain-containing protein [Plantactinospora sp. S1510]|uniref:Helix-turn-helix domain-containing protein n=1 Tax=Plantactinospora alkalitolerans TaxID=2789879 RepID=A0ABS0H353_9ACTN|nr:helix-turn-helix domain-containing protein [Plantactinospora alkalitolerans]MBF9132892.1 helix-turn-helix domain-containing protein [Plantactinospora alkalitolerans]